jgi:hypothetical protein
MPNENDLGLETLLAVRAQLGVDIDDTLLKQCFAIQRKHQFNPDRVQSSQAMDKLVDAHVEKMTKPTTQGEAE